MISTRLSRHMECNVVKKNQVIQKQTNETKQTQNINT